MTAGRSRTAADAAVASARCVLFAYHEMGYACMEALLALGAPIAALFTHQDDPGEEIWWRSCAELCARAIRFRFIHREKIGAGWIAQVAALQPAIIYSFYYRNLLPTAVTAIGADWRLQSARLDAAEVSRPRAGQLDAGQRRARGRRDAASYGGARRRRRYRGAARGRDHDDDTALTLYRKLVPLGAPI